MFEKTERTSRDTIEAIRTGPWTTTTVPAGTTTHTRDSRGLSLAPMSVPTSCPAIHRRRPTIVSAGTRRMAGTCAGEHALKKVCAGLLVSVVAGGAFAHGGGLNAEGCHNNRKTGDYHCHGAPSYRQVPADAAAKGTRGAGASPPAPAVASRPSRPDRNSGTGPTCYVGPRGGTYTITKSGKKNYSGC
jgi:hypothetical protein